MHRKQVERQEKAAICRIDSVAKLPRLAARLPHLGHSNEILIGFKRVVPRKLGYTILTLSTCSPPMTFTNLSRRAFLNSSLAFSAAALAGCASQVPVEGEVVEAPKKELFNFPTAPVSMEEVDPAIAYAALQDGEFLIPAVPYKKIDQQFLRQMVPNTTGEEPGTLVVVTSEHHLYYTMPGGFAMRYGVGLGKEGFEWTGEGVIQRKAVWPRWHPPEEMILRKPELKEFATTYDKKTKTYIGGMAGGLLNPLGARAHYIYQGDVDTQYRLHGSPEWNSIGKSVSSGCVRLINQDVVDLYDRVSEGTRVIVR
jgi:lipoprotein-anchoring transpeptidase ErfK/SrfK